MKVKVIHRFNDVKVKPYKIREVGEVFEDGDLFYMDEFSSEDEMYAEMIKEIEDDSNKGALF